jgi:hypothetical protein
MVVCCLVAGTIFMVFSGSALAAGQYGAVGQFGETGSLPGQFSAPSGVAVDQTTGDLYVGDAGNNRVEKFEANGTFLVSIDGTETPAKAFSAPTGVAVDNSSNPFDANTGDLYVLDRNNNVIDKFSAAGTYVGQITATAAGSFSELQGLAVDGNGNVWVSESSGEVAEFASNSANSFVTGWNTNQGVGQGLAVNGSGSELYVVLGGGNVARFSPGGGELGPLEPGPASGVAFDPGSGQVFVDDRTHVAAYEASGNPLPPVFGNGVLHEGQGLAFNDTVGQLFVAESEGAHPGEGNRVETFAFINVADVTTGAATALGTEGATLNGTVNPNATDAHCSFEYGTGTSYGHTAPCEPEDVGSGESPVPVHAAVTGLSTLTAYHYRLVVTEPSGELFYGQDETLHTVAAPAIEHEYTTKLSASEATLNAEINPNGEPTTYRFEYGPTASYGTTVPVPDGDVPAPVEVSGTGVPVSPPVSQLLTHLPASTAYHYRVVATNATGTKDGPDQTFETLAVETPVADTCPNAQVRAEQHSSFLPDCRDYELVSPQEKGNGDIVGDGVTTIASALGDAVAFSTRTPFGDEVGSGTSGQTQYVARRTGDGWASHAVMPTPQPYAYQTFLAPTHLQTFSEDLRTAIVWGYDLPGAIDSTPFRNNIYIENAATRALQGITLSQTKESLPPTANINIEALPMSADAQHVAYATSTQMLPAAAPGVPNVYQWDPGTGLSLAGILPDGTVPAGGSNVPHFETELGVLDTSEYRGAMSSDGSRLVFEAAPNGTRELYMRIDGSLTVPISEAPGRPEPTNVFLQAVTPDGHNVFFVTDSALLPGDTNAGPDLYRWSDSGDAAHDGTLTLISDTGDVTAKRGSVVGVSDDGDRVYYANETGLLRVWDDGATNVISSDVVPSGEPEHELGVAAAYPGGARVTPDGMWLAFVSKAILSSNGVHGLTGQVTNGRPEAYVYSLASQTLTCVSCTAGPTTDGASVTPDVTSGDPAIFNAGIRPRFLSDAGQMYFSTAAALVPQDVNGVEDVYEYDGPTGRLSLISSGTEKDPAAFADASANGSDVFFLTRSQLVAGDRDELVDLYDATTRASLPFTPEPAVSSCQGDGCQPPSSGSPPFGPPGSLLSTARAASPSAGKLLAAPASVIVRGLVASLRVRLSAPGTLTWQGPGVQSGSLKRASGAFTLRLQLTRRASLRLKTAGRFLTPVRLTLLLADGTRVSLTTRMTFRATTKKGR